MNRENALKWIDTLRSDKFDQTFYTISHGGIRRCCLGVAHECLIGSLINVTDVEARDCYGYVREALGISYTEEAEFIQLNDIAKLTFDEIADEVQKRITPQLEYTPDVL
jgi:hypothetical protein